VCRNHSPAPETRSTLNLSQWTEGPEVPKRMLHSDSAELLRARATVLCTVWCESLGCTCVARNNVVKRDALTAHSERLINALIEGTEQNKKMKRLDGHYRLHLWLERLMLF
jgi:hypothetical protein